MCHAPPSPRITPLSRPVRPAFNPSYEQTPADRAADRVWIAQRQALRAQFLSEWVPPPGYSPETEREEIRTSMTLRSRPGWNGAKAASPPRRHRSGAMRSTPG